MQGIVFQRRLGFGLGNASLASHCPTKNAQLCTPHDRDIEKPQRIAA